MEQNRNLTVPDDVADPFDDDELVAKALRDGVRDALRQHKQAGNTLVVREGDSLVELPADQIELPED